MPTAPSTSPTTPASATSRSGALIGELHAEAAATRRVIDRLPEDRLAWKPHAKSMSLGQLALHLAQLPLGIAMLVEPLTVEAPVVPLPQPTSVRDIIAALDRSVAHAAGRLAAWGDEGLDAAWTMTRGGVPVVTRSRGEIVRSLMFNHVYHHRGQLTVYLRLLDVPVPPTYGPTADENPFA
jgi:uncharacterized damage-inducible protein DinB